jgi:hypothetical protein
MIGVPALHDGRGICQAMFCVRLQVVGSRVASLTPVPRGPRHCGQFWVAPALLVAAGAPLERSATDESVRRLNVR